MSHDHHHVDPNAGDGRLIGAIAVNLGLTVAQVAGGLVSGSLAMIADALHNFSDAISLVIAAAARRIARRPSNQDMPFGYARAEVVAALVNYTTLIVIGLYLAMEAVLRFLSPEPVEGWLVVVIAGVALVVDLVTALLTWTMSKDSVNIRAAFLHNIADALGSVAVIAAGTLILLFGWTWVDPAVTLLIAGYILWMAFSEIGGVIRILMLGSPPAMVPGDVLSEAEAIEGVAGMHRAHLWQIDEHEAALQAHVVVNEGAWERADDIKAHVKARMRDRFGISHVVLEMECARHACASPVRWGDA
ncbi:cation diffusion facilitator family transporter [Salipiger aestuarii]|uniref:cation diffusion facilitator family transporter n=1 Tax=Salipiger aestuarii TaxID=568098 RepID=UPI0005568820|nr:cation diffusion facilitator family transporter [Salipiger aestuarii]KAA8605050.1 cation diffusion facilitator family transporter [Salipiger aestuarii]KAA8606761.1 cation diffusion facilitator family transporter [Salipiger aestuarii]